MREIKFRVWDTAQKKMITDGVVHDGGVWNDEWEFLSMGLGGDLRLESSCDNGKDGLHEHAIGFEADRFQLMQFTSLCDKNGKEIYEGDVLSFIYSTDEYRLISPVFWREDMLGWSVRFSIPKGYAPQFCVLPTLYDIEVIGNIHENIELLEGLK
ncbi:MAG: YopX family protein [Phycisphaerae bacterium]|jgi:hypothetical protein